MNLAKHKKIKNFYEKIIYVRDIYKQWYITGINNRLNSIDKVKEFLQKECEGYEITTCGSSAGGYMATVIGVKLGAKRVFTNSGQFSIEDTMPYRHLYASDMERNRYFNIIQLIQDCADNIYYFYPIDAEQDRRQYEMVRQLSLKRFSFKSSEHGKTMDAIVFPYWLTMSNQELDDCYRFFLNLNILPNNFYKRIIPFKDRMRLFPIKLGKNGKKILKILLRI